jgi:formamidopyrimidine-DNA glycosylase
MPELPDVEVFLSYFKQTSLNQTIESVDFHKENIIKGMTAGNFINFLTGQSFLSGFRYGKYLFGNLSSGKCLVFHFGMTGFLKYFKLGEWESTHDRLTLHFENNFCLAFNDQRLFGRVQIADNPDAFIATQHLGPDALTVDLQTFSTLFSKLHGTIKTVLMNQEKIAGLGNVYVDEILYQSKIHPLTSVDEIDKSKITLLFKKMLAVLIQAINAEADISKMPHTFLLPHRSGRGRCPICNQKIQRETVSGRSTYFCPSCQKL